MLYADINIVIRNPDQQQMVFNFFTVVFISSNPRGHIRVNKR